MAASACYFGSGMTGMDDEAWGEGGQESTRGSAETRDRKGTEVKKEGEGEDESVCFFLFVGLAVVAGF